MKMENQLNELTQMRSQLHKERKEKVIERRMLHDKSMENQEVQQYISSLPL
jgi:hypothetical protein